MKLTFFLLTAAFLQVSAKTVAQNNVSFSGKNVKLEKVFSAIEKQTGYAFFYNDRDLEKATVVTVNLKDIPLQEALSVILKNQNLNFSIKGKTIVIEKKQIPGTKTIELLDTVPNKPFPVIDVRGKIVDEAGEPVERASVQIKGSSKGTTTNRDGHFEMKDVDEKATIIISGVGIETSEVRIGGKTELLILAKTRVSPLDQLQIMAYSTTTRRLNVGNVTTIKSEEIAKHPVPNVLQAIQGLVPGMFISQQTGLPGGAFDVKIRGVQSFNGTSPLVIVDGVDYSSSFSNTTSGLIDGTLPLIPGLNGTRNFLRGGNTLNFLDPSEIESIDVLKDAAATAVYGSRGAYGVVLITTKKAKSGKPVLSLNAFTGIDQRGTFPRLLNTAQYLMLRREAFKNDGVIPGANQYDVNGTWPENRYTNWPEELTGDHAVHSKINLNYGGGSGNINYRISGHYSAQNNVQKGKGGVKEGGMAFDINTTTSKNKLFIDLSGTFSSTVNDMVPFDFSNDYSATTAPNAPPLFLPDGSLNWETGSNPAAAMNLIYKQNVGNMVSRFIARYTPVKGLSINASVAFNSMSGKELFGQPTTYFIPTTNAGTQAKSTFGYFSSRTWIFDPNASYSRRLGSRGTITAIAGATVKDVLNQRNSISGTNFASDALLHDPALGGTVTASFNQDVNRYFGSFAQIKYDWSHKYILELSGRYDGSTKFGPDHRFGAFGAIGANWIISEEAWFRQALPFISFAKFRGSYGTVGGDGIASYQYLTRYQGSTAYVNRPTLIVNSLRNPTLHWETKRQIDVGGTLEFLKGRITIEGSYSRSRSSDLLVQQPLTGVTGYTTLAINADALIQNTSVEGTLVTKNIQTSNVTWMTNMNITLPGSKLLAFPNGNIITLNSNYAIGRPITGIFLYRYAGVNPQTGNYNFYNGYGDKGEFPAIGAPPGVKPLSQADKVEFVDLAPKFYGSISNTIRYKRLSIDFQVFINNRIGKNYFGSQLFSPGQMNFNPTVVALRRWQKPGDVTDVPKATQGLAGLTLQNNFLNSTGAYETAMYARLQNVNISYELPQLLLQKMKISKMNVYIQGQNIFTVSKYKDLDPENLAIGSMPPLRTFIAGLNVSF